MPTTKKGRRKADRFPDGKIPWELQKPEVKELAKALKRVDQDVLMEVLKASGEPKFQGLATYLENSKDQKEKRWTLAEMCGFLRIKPAEVAQLFKETMLAEGSIRQMQLAPQIMESNARAAIGRMHICGTCGGAKRLTKRCGACEGKGKLVDEEKKEYPCQDCLGTGALDDGPCLTCGESGWVQDAGDPDALKVFAESAGLTNQSKGPLVNINQNFGGGAGSFEDLMRTLERKPPKIIEGEVSESV